MNKNAPLYPIVFMAVLALVFGAAVAGVAELTRDRVEVGSVARFRSHVLAAAGVEAPKDYEALAALWAKRVTEQSAGGERYFRIIDGAGSLAAVALVFRAPGFWGPINGVLALSPDGATIEGVSFISHEETPGLGGRISEKWFTEQFRGKSVARRNAGEAILDFVYRTPRTPHEVEAITGATQTSSRLARFMNDYLAGLDNHPAFAGGGKGARP